MSIDLFKHNQDAYDKVTMMFESTKRVAVVHPTGTGKSFIAFKLAENNPDKSFLWVSPSRHIFNTQVKNLRDSCGYVDISNIRFVTYHALMMMELTELEELVADYLILDEFHRCGAEKWGQGVQDYLHYHSRIKVLGLSATNIRYLDDQRDMAAELFNNNIASYMTLGEAVVLGILQAPRYIVSMYSYDEELKKYYKWIENLRGEKYRYRMQKHLDELKRDLGKSEGLQSFFAKYMDKSGKYIAFCLDVNHMEEMVGNIYEWVSAVDKNSHIYCIYSEMGEEQTSEMLEAFRNDRSLHTKILFSVNMLNEGVHFEDIDGVILFRPTISPIVYKQQIGRAFSAFDKTPPVIFDIVNNFENVHSIASIQREMNDAVRKYETSGEKDRIIRRSFEIIDETMESRALFKNLESMLATPWDEYFERAKEYKDKYGDILIPHEYRTEDGLSLGVWLSIQRSKKKGRHKTQITPEQIARLDSLGMVWDLNMKRWDEYYHEAEKYYKENGNLHVPKGYITEDGCKLGDWIGEQRRKRKYRARGVITDEQIKMLDSIGMIWSMDEKWDVMYEKAKSYYEAHGNLLILSTYVTEDGYNLGHWISYQRGRLNITNLTEPISLERKEKLNRIGMVWDFDIYNLQWERNYNELCRYKEKHENIDIPSDYCTQDGTNLRNWVQAQRSRNNAGILDEKKKAKLESIGLIWDVKQSKWDTHYLELVAYKEQTGDANPGWGYVTDGGFNLGRWLAKQRSLSRKGELDETKREKLICLGVTNI